MEIIFKNIGFMKIEFLHDGEKIVILCHPEAQEILTELSKEMSAPNIRSIDQEIFFDILELHLF